MPIRLDYPVFLLALPLVVVALFATRQPVPSLWGWRREQPADRAALGWRRHGWRSGCCAEAGRRHTRRRCLTGPPAGRARSPDRRGADAAVRARRRDV